MASSAASPKVAHLLALAVGTSSVVSSSFSLAQSAHDGAVAQALFDDARSLMARGNYSAACPKLEESQRLDPGSGTLINLGDCYEHQGRQASAWTTFLDAAAAAHSSGNQERERVSRERAAAIEPHLARLMIRVTAEKVVGLEIRRDGAIVRSGQWGTGIPADSGEHTVAASAPGRKAWQRTVTLRDGVIETVVIPDLATTESSEPAPTKGNDRPPSGEAATALGTQRIVALAATGAGVAGIVVGTVFGLRSISKRAESDKTCAGASCSDQQGADLMADAQAAGNISTAAFVVGAVGLAAGGVLWFTATPNATTAQLGIGVGSIQLRGNW